MALLDAIFGLLPYLLVIILIVVALSVVSIVMGILSRAGIVNSSTGFVIIGPDEFGMVTKRFGRKNQTGNQVVVFDGGPGYQGELLKPGMYFAMPGIKSIEKFKTVTVPMDSIGYIYAQVGRDMPPGAVTATGTNAKSGEDITTDDYLDVKKFIEIGGEKGIQRHFLPPGTVIRLHPVAFVIKIKGSNGICGKPLNESVRKALDGLDASVTVIAKGKIGVVTANEGIPLGKGMIASEVGPSKIAELEKKYAEKALPASAAEAQLVEGESVEAVIVSAEGNIPALESEAHIDEGKKSNLQFRKGRVPDLAGLAAILDNSGDAVHSFFSNAQAFVKAGGHKGIQIHVISAGYHLINKAVFSVTEYDMLNVKIGEVAVITDLVGLEATDVSGEEFMYGGISPIGHKGVCEVTMKTGEYTFNPDCYRFEMVPTQMFKLGWNSETQDHKLDEDLEPIKCVSKEGFPFVVKLSAQLHIPETEAAKIISSVGSTRNLIKQILDPAVCNHFLTAFAGMEAVAIIEGRKTIEKEATDHMRERLKEYNNIQLKALLIEGMDYPPEITQPLKNRQVAEQEKTTYDAQKLTQESRALMLKESGIADMQKDKAKYEIGIQIAKDKAAALLEAAKGKSSFILQTGKSKAEVIEATQKAGAAGIKAKVDALGSMGPLLTTVMQAVEVFSESQKGIPFLPRTYVGGGGSEGMDFNGLIVTAMQALQNYAASMPQPEEKPIVISEENREEEPAENTDEENEAIPDDGTELTDMDADSTSGMEGEENKDSKEAENY
jgi:regulator of protease activity HflC (stomatin/prohibitin superfamily)